jgi:hypothetical protein
MLSFLFQTSGAPNVGTWSLDDIDNDNESNFFMNTESNKNSGESGAASSYSSTTTTTTSNDSSDFQMDDFFNPAAAKFRPQQQISSIQKPNSSANLGSAQSLTIELEKEKRELEARLEEERAKLQEQLNLNIKRTVQQEQKLTELKQRLEDMQQQQQKLKAQETKLQQISNSIKTFEFANIQIEVVNDFLTQKFELILNNLRKVSQNLDPYLVEKKVQKPKV